MTVYDFGPQVRQDQVSFRLWAPKSASVELLLGDSRTMAMQAGEDGWHSCTVPGLAPGARYKFRLVDGLEVPDPGSRFQPDDVHGESEVIDLATIPRDSRDWKGRPWEEMVIYEMHVGAFTQAGTFRAAIERLDHLRNLGVTAIQVMPISDFPGRYGWGYDGVLPYAPEASYGRPEDVMAFIDAAHARGLSVFLDVVYNHFGPDGNYLAAYAPLFTERHRTPWGDGINYDGEDSRPIREFVIQNAIHWIATYGFDGLRLDAVHGIQDDSAEHLLHELARRVRAAAGDRHVHLVVENEENDSDLLIRGQDGRPEQFTAQWNDDIHHVLHVAATGETFGYYQDYVASEENLGRALAEGFVYQGDHMPYRGDTRGKPSAGLPPTAFISFIQNHDQIGNRALGDRMAASQPSAPLKAIAAVYLLAPEIPMLFMGEEFGSTKPFPYFCDFNEELNKAVRDGRRKELSRLPGFDADSAADPTAESTFRLAKLDWDFGASEQAILAYYAELLAIRAREIAPRLAGARSGKHSRVGNGLRVEWPMGDGSTLVLLANLSAEPLASPVKGEGRLLWGTQDGGIGAPWSVAVSLVE